MDADASADAAYAPALDDEELHALAVGTRSLPYADAGARPLAPLTTGVRPLGRLERKAGCGWSLGKAGATEFGTLG